MFEPRPQIATFFFLVTVKLLLLIYDDYNYLIF